MSEKITDKILMWLLGIIGTLLVAGILGGLKFYNEWSADEATEDAEKEALMFDNPSQKVEIVKHPKEVPSALEQRLKINRDEDFQKAVLDRLDNLEDLSKRTSDQAYQANRRTDTLNSNISHALEHVDQ